MLKSTRRMTLVVATIAAAALVAACSPDSPPETTTTTSPGGSTVKTVTDATFEWTISREADNGTFAGVANYWSAGRSDSTEATYVATDGNATVLKKNAAGTYVPIGSESAVSWANRNKDGAGVTVTANSANYLGQKVRYTNGTGTVDTATGVAAIQWTGTFTVNFYGHYVPFWIVNPKLTVDAAGKGTVTATLGGYASSIGDPDTRVELPDTANIVLAELPNVYSSGSITTGFASALPNYLGRAITAPAGSEQVVQTPANSAYWGAWPQSFTDFQQATGLGAYWYTSGLTTTDTKKPQEPISVTYTLNP